MGSSHPEWGNDCPATTPLYSRPARQSAAFETPRPPQPRHRVTNSRPLADLAGLATSVTARLASLAHIRAGPAEYVRSPDRRSHHRDGCFRGAECTSSPLPTSAGLPLSGTAFRAVSQEALPRLSRLSFSPSCFHERRIGGPVRDVAIVAAPRPGKVTRPTSGCLSPRSVRPTSIVAASLVPRAARGTEVCHRRPRSAAADEVEP